MIAGDTHVTPPLLREFLDTLNKVPIIVILGNHEYYGKDLYQAQIDYKDVVHCPEKQIYLLQDTFVELPEIIVHGATLWSDYSNCPDRELMEMTLHDFKEVGFEGMTVNTNILEMEFKHSVYEMKKNLFAKESSGKKQVVVTHHAPSFRSLNYTFVGEPNNWAYMSNLEEMIADYAPELWIHGHTHSSFDYTVEKTHVICNPYGYFGKEVNGKFNKQLVVEV